MKGPEFGDERIVYVNQEVRREVFAQEGRTTFWDDDAKDWETWPGRWIRVETLGTFATAEEARDFLAARR